MMAETPVVAGNTRHLRWVASALLCAGLQVGLTTALPDQRWTMPAGIAALAALCAASTITRTPRSATRTEAWRWHVATAAFAIWSVNWAAAAVFLPAEWAVPILSMIGLLRQVLFLIVLLPTVEEDHGWQLRALDAGQVALMGATLAILSWPGAALLHLEPPTNRFLYIGHLALAIVAVASYLRQDGKTRCLIRPLMLLHVLYALTSITAALIDARWNVPARSPIWVFGDIAFIAYLWSPRPKSKIVQPRLDVPSVPHHLPPLLLAAVILMLSVEVGRRSLPWGMSLGIVGLAIYAARTTFLNGRYLAARDHLIQIEEARGRALVDIVHEIRSPLGSVTLNAWLLAQGEAIPHPQRRWVEQIHASTTRVTALLNDVLDLERLDAGLVELDIRPCDTQAVAADALTVVAPQAKEYGITLAPPTGTALPHVIADPAKLGRVLVNLATNAVRFTPRGGRVTVAIRYLDAHRVAITVEDTGIGIPAAAQQHLFERFGHIETPVNGLRGSGLGLSICRGLITAMRGELTIASTPQVGTTATIVLPASDEYSPAATI